MMSIETLASAMVAPAGPTTTAPSVANDLFGGTTNLLLLLVLAFAGALVVGNVLALVRPPKQAAAARGQGPPPKPSVTRSVVMITIGMVVVIWTLASLLS